MTDFDKEQIKGFRRKKPKNKKQSPEDILADWVDAGYSGNVSEDGSVWIYWGLNTRFHDTGDMITIHGPVTDEAIQSMLDVARSHGWTSIEFFGDENFKARACRLASLMDPPFEVDGYELPVRMNQSRLDLLYGDIELMAYFASVDKSGEDCWKDEEAHVRKAMQLRNPKKDIPEHKIGSTGFDGAENLSLECIKDLLPTWRAWGRLLLLYGA